jgi:hypothetical protein
MSRGLLSQVAALQVNGEPPRKSSSQSSALPPSHVLQSYADDLESLFYVFIWICIKYSGPHGMERKDCRRNWLPNNWANMSLEMCNLKKVYFFAVAAEEARLETEFHPYFAKLIPLAKEWRAVLKDNMENGVTFDSILGLLERHLATLPDDEEISSTKEKLRKSATNLNVYLKKRAHSAEVDSSIPMQGVKRKKR